MKLLALDLSTKCIGWSVLDSKENLIDCGTIPLDKFKTKKFPLEYTKQAYNELVRIIIQHQPTDCAVEAAFNRNTLTLKALCKIRGIAELACANNDILQIKELNASHVRSVVFNNGSIKKEELYEILSQKYENIYNDGLDISDSIALGLCYIKELNCPPVTKKQKKKKSK